MKLEEAHISAPSRTKLKFNNNGKKKKVNLKELNLPKKIYKSKLKNKKNVKNGKKVNNVTKIKETPDNNELKKNVIQPVMEVTLDDTDEFESESPEESSKETDEILKIKEKSLTNSLDKESCQISDELQNFYDTVKGSLDFIISERKHTSYLIGNLEKSASKKSCITQDNIIEILDKDVSISDEKADSENQDLFSDNSRPLIIDEGNAPIERINLNQSRSSSLEIKETIVIDSVSSEKIELLEQFESAIININQEING